MSRAMIPMTNEHFAAFCLQMVGQPYWYGTCLYKCSDSLRTRKAEQYPSHYKDSRTEQYKADIRDKKVCADCIGACKGYAWTSGGQNILEAIGTDLKISSKYGSNGCPDKSANGMFAYAKSKGMDYGCISTLPDVVGLAVHKDGHVGFTVGNGYAVEWQGFSSGCVKTKIAERSWTDWYQLPFIDYGDTSTTGTQPAVSMVLGARTLKKGMEGSDVRTLQELLIQLGYALNRFGADGDFGTETESAVIAFQKHSGLKPDGLYGDLTHQALMDAIADDEDGKPTKTPQPEEDVESPQLATVVIVSDGGKVNIRTGNSTSYSRITSASPGTTFNYIATALNGWHAIDLGSKIGWVSGSYSRVISV